MLEHSVYNYWYITKGNVELCSREDGIAVDNDEKCKSNQVQAINLLNFFLFSM
jgi:hypothetical protein